MAKTHIGDVRTIGIPVTDQNRALSFYVDKLGFETRLDHSMGNGRRWIEVAASGAAVSLALVPASDDAPAGVETGVRLTSSNADADHAALRTDGVDVDEVLRWPGVPAMFMFRDQDGNRLEIVERQG